MSVGRRGARLSEERSEEMTNGEGEASGAQHEFTYSTLPPFYLPARYTLLCQTFFLCAQQEPIRAQLWQIRQQQQST